MTTQNNNQQPESLKKSICCNDDMSGGVQCLNCGADGRKKFECETCEDTGEVSTMEQVTPGEPHMADVGTEPCPDCKNNEPDDMSGVTEGDR